MRKNVNILNCLQKWYESNCDGDWEHSYGIKIETLDNPGWSVHIDLSDTSLEGVTFQKEVDNGTDDWIVVKVENQQFTGWGDFSKLEALINIFFDEVLPLKDSNYTYECFTMIRREPGIWVPVRAEMINERTFRVVEVPAPSRKDVMVESEGHFESIPAKIDPDWIHTRVGDVVSLQLHRMYDGVHLVIVE